MTLQKQSQQPVERARKKELSPELSAWLDRVIVPALVREYLEKEALKNTLAVGREAVAESDVKSKATVEGVE